MEAGARDREFDRSLGNPQGPELALDPSEHYPTCSSRTSDRQPGTRTRVRDPGGRGAIFVFFALPWTVMVSHSLFSICCTYYMLVRLCESEVMTGSFVHLRRSSWIFFTLV